MPSVPRPLATPAGPFRNPSNRFSLDYRDEGRAFPPPPVGIIDAHTHVNGGRAAELMREAMDLYGIERVWSMTALDQVEAVRKVLGDRLELIAIPDWASKDRLHANGPGFLENIRRFHDLGARIVKFWAAPRAIDYGIEAGDAGLFRLDSPDRLKAMELADSLGMTFMAHVADPDTWFATRYRDASRYGTKRSHYEPFESLLDRFRHRRWIAAHLGGWPEDLAFLDGLLGRNPNLVLDASATKWMVREVSRHPREALVAFLKRHEGRILFGSDIVTTDDHLRPGEGKTEMQAKADSVEDAFDLYASRYWALRSMWEAAGEIESPIGDPDLAMVAPDRHGPHDAPRLRGFALPEDLLRTFYRGAAESIVPPR